MSDKQPISALVVIYTKNLDVLLIERADYPGSWQSVTGSWEPGESLADTAAREAMEETGFDAAQFELTDWHIRNQYEIFEKWRHRYPAGTLHNTEHVFGLCLPARLTPTLSPREHVSFVWLPWPEAADKVFSASNAQAIRMLPGLVATPS